MNISRRRVVMSKYPRPKVGDTVWFFDCLGKTLQEHEVTKVGRKYFHTSRNRIHLETWCVDDGGRGSRRSVYLSKEIYEEEAKLENSFREIKSYFRNLQVRPEHLTQDKLDKIMEILEINNE